MHCTFIHLFLLSIGRVSAPASTRPYPIDSVDSSVTASIASTLPFPTSDPGPLDRDHNHSYGLMTHTTSYGFMNHRLKIQGSLPEDTTKTTAPGTWPDTGGYVQSHTSHPSSPNSSSNYHRESGLPDSRLGGPKPRSKSGQGPDFRLGSGAGTPQSSLRIDEVLVSHSADRYNINPVPVSHSADGYTTVRNFLRPRGEPGSNTSYFVLPTVANNFPVVHPNPNTFRTTTSTEPHHFVETITYPDNSFGNYGSSTMDEHAIKSVPNISEQFTRWRARKRQLDDSGSKRPVQPAHGIPAFLTRQFIVTPIINKLAAFLCGLMPYTPQGFYPIYFVLAIFIVGLQLSGRPFRPQRGGRARPGQGNQNRLPPQWGPAMEERPIPYLFREWMTDIRLWVTHTDLHPAAQVEMIIPRLSGRASSAVERLSEDERRLGGIINGLQLDPVSFLLESLRIRLDYDNTIRDRIIRAQLARELDRLMTLRRYQQFVRYPDESIAHMIRRFNLVRLEAIDAGNFLYYADEAAHILINRILGFSPAEVQTFLDDHFGGEYPSDEGEFSTMQAILERRDQVTRPPLDRSDLSQIRSFSNLTTRVTQHFQTTNEDYQLSPDEQRTVQAFSAIKGGGKSKNQGSEAKAGGKGKHGKSFPSSASHSADQMSGPYDPPPPLDNSSHRFEKARSYLPSNIPAIELGQE